MYKHRYKLGDQMDIVGEKFKLGMVLATPGAVELSLDYQIDLVALLYRHVTGDWGDLGKEDKRTNEQSVRFGNRILSSYGEEPQRIWIITEADRSSTTILRPEEY